MNKPLTETSKNQQQARFIPRELSWLSFNARVLQEAQDASVPVIQRLRYLGIFSNNLDEFFRVRVAEVRRLIYLSTGSKQQRYKQLLSNIQRRVVELQWYFEDTYLAVLRDLRKRHIYIVDETQLDQGQATFVRDYFRNRVLPELEPILLDQARAELNLTDESIYLAADLKSGEDYHYALIEVPTDRLDRFVQIPKLKGKSGRVYIVLENIIRFCLPEVFRGVITIDESAAYTIKFSRDAELEIDTGISESLIEKMSSSLRARQRAEPVRFVYDADIPDRLLSYLVKRFKLGKYDSLIGGGRYHNSKDLMSFPRVGPKYLELMPLPTLSVPRLEREGSLFALIREKDVLLYYPYHPFDYITNLLKTAALDPGVRSIRICLYRVAKNSRVCDALINAMQNGKQVLAVVELQARFDEQANINWAQRLADAGVDVRFGVPGIKVHSKLILIERWEDGKKRYYSHIGTGNFNEKTAQLYTDFSLLTYDQDIGQDIFQVFDFLQFNYKRPEFRHLMVSPHTSRSAVESLIDREIENARAGYRAAMTLKCNNLVDRELAEKLYEASGLGVEIKLIIRGMCSVIPGIAGMSDNIRGISIVDRYLEHSRVFVFYNRGKPEYLIGSADLMTRNLDARVEVLCPILDRDAQKLVQQILDLQWYDNVKARILDAEQSNILATRKGVKVRSQEAIHRYLETGELPRLPRSRMNRPAKRRRKK